jgi:hypothetical protein
MVLTVHSMVPFSDDPTNLANAFTRSGLVKHFWNLNGSEGQPSGRAPPDADTELIPSGTSEAKRRLGKLSLSKQSPRRDRHRLVPFRQYREVLGADLPG